MTTYQVAAIVAAPLLGPLIWRALMSPGRWLHDALWKRLPDGRLRSLLLRKV